MKFSVWFPYIPYLLGGAGYGPGRLSRLSWGSWAYLASRKSLEPHGAYFPTTEVPSCFHGLPCRVWFDGA